MKTWSSHVAVMTLYCWVLFSVSGCAENATDDAENNVGKIEAHFGSGGIELSDSEKTSLRELPESSLRLTTISVDSADGGSSVFSVARVSTDDASSNLVWIGGPSFVAQKTFGEAKAAAEDCSITFPEARDPRYQDCIESVLNEIDADCKAHEGKSTCADHCWLGELANKCK